MFAGPPETAVKWLSDENFDNDIVRGVVRRSLGFDVVRAQDLLEVAGQPDAVLLGWATRNVRTVLTHDLSTGSCAPICSRARFTPDRFGYRGDSITGRI